MNTTRMIAKYDVPKKNLKNNIPIKLKSKTKRETKMGRILEKFRSLANISLTLSVATVYSLLP